MYILQKKGWVYMEKDFIEELNDIEILEDKVEERLLDLINIINSHTNYEEQIIQVRNLINYID